MENENDECDMAANTHDQKTNDHLFGALGHNAAINNCIYFQLEIEARTKIKNQVSFFDPILFKTALREKINNLASEMHCLFAVVAGARWWPKKSRCIGIATFYFAPSEVRWFRLRENKKHSKKKEQHIGNGK